MNSVIRQSLNLLKRPPGEAVEILSSGQYQQWRGIRVKVFNGNLDQALRIMERRMRGSGIERMIKNEQTYHLKNSEKRVLARKALEVKIRSQELARKMKAILIQKVRYFIFVKNGEVHYIRLWISEAGACPVACLGGSMRLAAGVGKQGLQVSVYRHVFFRGFS
ncbi:hypothetical protein L484_027683 [Morus notabilis]|uniref:30S ribosomal protein S21 n=1 Tax=Morus notabilis TaxID=981085 RepID=W9RCH2_9ROSA|nr:hypothetical protein L484_027683 [Morus notabilis]